LLKKDIIFNSVLPAFYSVTVAFLASLGEKRLDAYLSLLTLEYLFLYTILRPKRRKHDLVLIALLVVFFIAVALRIAEVLGI